ncbi:LapA family protein [Rhodopirellula sp. JC740]|uniref:LapA family protein n=1 Tax=Rhodopirellula halodulae TaxID=2894198 RepID=A0ABS8NJT1_9BACT|nr:LapA family protein [Rhodopirellula sp. JC740]MCC9643800.1 LapA family protein [Rhodopirellula sp. JC740]
MRIPNQINRDNLYSRRERISTPTQTYRRLFRLLLALVLVLMVMKQAARPGVYAIFFPETMVQIQPGPSQQEPLPSGEVSNGEPAPGLASESQTGEATEPNASTNTTTDEWETLQAEIAQQILSERGLSEAGTLDDTERTPSRMEQESLIAQIKDGTVWRAADQPALCATLALHRSPSKSRGESPGAWNQHPPFEPVVETGVLPLLQQPDVYQGRTVRGVGKLARLNRVQANSNHWGIDHYWECWLQPEDGSQRPWLTIVPDLPSGLRQLAPAETHPVSVNVASPQPTIVVEGEFIKRLSYQSANGAELTPVVVGHVHAVRSNGNRVVAAGLRSATNQSSTAPRTQSNDVSIGTLVGIATLIGLTLGIVVMWRSRVLHQRMRARRNARNVTLPTALVLATALSIGCFGHPVASAQDNSATIANSLLDVLPGFDPSRLQQLGDQMKDAAQRREAVNEQAKLVFRLKRLSDDVLQQRANEASDSAASIGDAIEVAGTIESLRLIQVPTELVEFLNLRQVVELQIQTPDSATLRLICGPLPDAVAVGDEVSGIGVALEEAESFSNTNQPPTASTVTVAAAGNLRWKPRNPTSLGWEVLGELDVDLSRLPEIATLSRQPLGDRDSTIFFSMIGAAHQAGTMTTDQQPLGPTVSAMRAAVAEVKPADLLKSPEEWLGQWIALDAETVRWTRVAIESETRQQQVGQDHYFQLDAIGDLGNVQLKIATGNGETVTMENRFPVTFVTARLPAFLGSSDALSGTVAKPVRVEGFFYRLWSYESDFMASHGGKQFAPLVIAGRWIDQTPASNDPIGVRWIGTLAAIAVVMAIAGALLFAGLNRRGDRRAKAHRGTTSL